MVYVAMRFGEVRREFDVHVCGLRRPMHLASPILRADGDSWRVMPLRYMRDTSDGLTRIGSIPCALADCLARGDSLVLTCAPPEVSAALEALDG